VRSSADIKHNSESSPLQQSFPLISDQFRIK
jgi:hypothetical protein